MGIYLSTLNPKLYVHALPRLEELCVLSRIQFQYGVAEVGFQFQGLGFMIQSWIQG